MEWHRTPPYGSRERAPFVLIVAITACGTLGMHLIIPALPDTARSLGVSAGTIQLTITLYLIGLAIAQLLYGPVSDRFGRRPVLLAGLALFTLAGLATTAAPNAWTLVIARILQSIGACAGLVLGRAIVRDSATADRATAQLALLTLVMSAAPAIAPVLGGTATAWFGWRAAFALLAIVGAVTLVFAIPSSRENPKICGIDDAEVVGDLVAVDMPVPRHRLAKKSQHRATEILEPSIAFVVGAVPVHQSPQSFDWVQMRAV